MKTKDRHLEGEGEMDYDFVNDILFFKVKDREYNRSLEFGNLVIDIDLEDFIVGIQIFEASKFLKISKANLRKIPKWRFQASINPETIEIRLTYQVDIRNRIFERSPIIINENKPQLPDSEMVCPA